MAKKLAKKMKLQIDGGQANPAPPLGPALGQAGVNIGEFVNQFNEATQDRMGEKVSVVLNVYDDRSFDFSIKTPPATGLILKAAGVQGGSGKNKTRKVASITDQQLTEIAEEKFSDLNARDIDAAKNIVKGSCYSMGIEVK